MLHLVPWAATTLLLLCTSGCTRTITWEEEVPLNTGETIWIERSMPWAPLGSQGNPFDIGMRPTREQTIRFEYQHKNYRYTGRADVAVIAISPLTRIPVLVAPASSYAWDQQNSFTCAIPHYVQLIPDASGSTWTWPQKIEPWLYNISANVMASLPRLNEDRKQRYTRADRASRDVIHNADFAPRARIDPSYKEGSCLQQFGS
ncbi:hypothetical protein [Ramlibacter sp.]|uniref:hypothetical protein n=1 Tax=Ramlibacter sp. TaxID=1917967 RepID=UPI002CBBB039|nr:hypothetical protein [Ramlibacter sp.]HWI80422.1 hypothetical protein [Ramlibacter sp.]